MLTFDPVWIWVGILVFGIAMTTGYLNWDPKKKGRPDEKWLAPAASLESVRSGITSWEPSEDQQRFVVGAQLKPFNLFVHQPPISQKLVRGVSQQGCVLRL